jgi:Leucine-rich repeat (LRR) protein
MVGRNLLAACFFILSGLISLSGQNVEHLIQDADDLNSFFNQLSGNGWKSSTNWPVETEPEPSLKTPYGVELIVTDTLQINDTLVRYVYEVEEMRLSYNDLNGNIPAVVFQSLKEMYLSGNSISSIAAGFSAPQLEKLYLGSNQISSWSDPSLPALRNLDLGGNQLTEIVGSGVYSSLETLTLNDNQITSLSNLSDFPTLKSIDLGSNQISGSIPNIDVPTLEVLILWNNQLTGSLPTFQHLSQLKELQLSGNNLIGQLPSSFGFDATIEQIGFSGNAFSGTIPAYSFPNALSFSLEGLDLQLEGELPMFQMPKLKSLNLRNNHRITGPLPEWDMPDLEYLALKDLSLNGDLPPLNFPKMKSLDLADNHFTGPMPDLNMPDLEYVRFRGSDLIGSMPAWSLPEVREIDISGNELKGAFPELQCPKLYNLYISGNQFTGTFPDLGNRFNNLWMGANDFEGIASGYGSEERIYSLQCGSNQLEFDDILPFTYMGSSWVRFRYYPQDSVPMYAEENDDKEIILTAEVGGGVNYQWYQNGEMLAGETSTEINIGKNGNPKEYTCAVTNPALPELTINTRLAQKPGPRCWENDYFKICLEDPEAGWYPTGNDHELLASEAIVFNEFLYFDGSCTIDTQQLSVVVDGVFRLKEVPLPGGGTGNFKLAEGKYELALAGASGTLTGFINDQLSTFTPDIGGLEIKLDELLLLGGKSADGVSISFTVAFDALSPGCGNGSPATTKIAISGLEMRSSGISVSGLQVGDLGFAPGFCLKELGASYDQDKDKLSFGLTLLTPFIEVGGGLGFIAGEVDSIAMRAVLQNAIIPIGATGVGLIGCEGRISNLTNPPWNMRFGGIFSAVASDDLFQLTTSVEYIPPATLKVEAGDGKLFNPPVFDDWWQVEGGIYGSIDLRDYKMKVGGTIDMAPFLDNGEKKFIGSGAIDLAYRKHNERATFLGTFEGMLTLPTLGSHFPFDWLSAKLGLPYSASADGLVVHKPQSQFMRGSLDMGGRIGKLSYRLEYAKAYDDFNYFALDVEEADVSAGLAEDGNQEFVIPAETRMAVVRVGTDIDVQATDLTDPSGNVWTAANPGPDATLDVEGEKFFWTLYAPEAGTWTFNGPETAELDVYLFGAQSAFTIEQNIEGDSLYLTWSAFDFVPGDSLDFFADEDTLGSNGGYFATVDALEGGYSIHLSDLSAFCSFYVQAVGLRQDQLVSDYAEGMIRNPFQPLSLPEDIVANYYTDSGLLVVDWLPVQDPDVVGYMVELFDGVERTVIGNVYADESYFRYPMAAWNGETVFITSYGADGGISCPSDEVAILTGTDQEFIQTKHLSLKLYPNPNYGRAILDVFTQESGEAILSVYAIDGRLMHRVERSYLRGWNQEELQLTHLPKGYYIIQVILPEQQASVKMIRLGE